MTAASLAREGQQYLGSADVARLLGITVSAASKRISRGAFGPAVRNGATWHVSLAQFQAAMGGGTAPAPAPATPRRAAPRRRPLALRIRGAGRRAGHDHTAPASGHRASQVAARRSAAVSVGETAQTGGDWDGWNGSRAGGSAERRGPD